MTNNADKTQIKGYTEYDIRISIPRVSSKIDSNNESFMVFFFLLFLYHY